MFLRIFKLYKVVKFKRRKSLLDESSKFPFR